MFGELNAFANNGGMGTLGIPTAPEMVSSGGSGYGGGESYGGGYGGEHFNSVGGRLTPGFGGFGIGRLTPGFGGFGGLKK